MNQKGFLRIGFLFVLLLITGLGATAVFIPTARAQTITVTTTIDDVTNNGNCTLREAIIAANTDTAVDACPAGNGHDTIIVPAGSYELALTGISDNTAQAGDLDITDDLNLDGAGRVTTIIDANGLERPFQIIAGNVQIDGVTVTGGSIGSGGGINVSGGSLTLINSRVEGNESSGLFVTNGAALNLIETFVNDNHTLSGPGGGIYIASGSLTMTNSQVQGNTAEYGAGIKTNIETTALIYNSTISDNSADSSSNGGGGIQSSGSLTIVNSTISGNSAAGSGGGLVMGSGSTASLYNVTITNNTADTDNDNIGDGGGIRIASGAVNFRNTIIAGNFDNSASNQHPDCSGTFNSLGYNLINNTTGCVVLGDTSGNLTGVSALLGPLQSNGGSSETHALIKNSPAIEGGNPKGCYDDKETLLTTDQRGYVRTGVCDIGAYEYNSPGVPTATPTPTVMPSITPTATPSPTATSSSTATATSTPTATNTGTPPPTIPPEVTATSTPETAQNYLYLPIIVR